MSDIYQNLSHSRWNCKYHVVFVPKRRRKTLYGTIRKALGAIFRGRPPRPEGRGFHAPGWLRCGPAGATSFPPRPEGRGFSEDLDDFLSLREAVPQRLLPQRRAQTDATRRRVDHVVSMS